VPGLGVSSQASPTPSESASSCPGFGTLSQLSVESGTPSESASGGGGGPAQSGSAASTSLSPSLSMPSSQISTGVGQGLAFHRVLRLSIHL
jgi:hypothetical protein